MSAGMKTLPYETATAGDRALQELQRVLQGFGCQNFGTMIDNERQVVIVAFKWRERQVHMEASWRGYAMAWTKRHPWSRQSRLTRPDYDRRALAQGRVSVCSVLRDWVKAQTVAIECGILQFEEVFMPHMLLPDGRRVIQAAREAKVLPQISHEDQKIVELKL